MMIQKVQLSDGLEYEFDDRENAILKGLAASLLAQGAAWLALGAADIAVAALWSAGTRLEVGAALISGLVALGIGVFFLASWTGVRDAITTRGYDITNIMRTMKRLRTLHTLQGVFFIVAALFVFALLVIALGWRS